MATQNKLEKINLLNVEMDGVPLVEDSSKCEMLLGCKIKSNLKWSDQVSYLSSRLVKRLTALNYLKFICPFKIRKQITESMFNGILKYCLPLFGGMNVGEIRNLQLLQNKSARLVCRAPSRAHRQDLLEKLSWLNVNQQISYQTLLLIGKIRRNKAPDYLAKILTNDSRNNRIMIEFQPSILASRSFCYRGVSEWNKLPSSIRLSTDRKSFEKELKTWVLTNVPKFI